MLRKHSTDYHRKPCGENVTGGVNVSIMVCPTFWAVSLPDIKRQFIDNVSALSTAFGIEEPTLYFNPRRVSGTLWYTPFYLSMLDRRKD